MYLIKKLRLINLTQFKIQQNQNLLENQNLLDKDLQTIRQDLQNRRSKIVERALAQSMVEGQLLRKYFSGLNAKGLSTSNYKVGQIHDKTRLAPKKNSTKLQNINLKIDRKQANKQVQNRQSVSKSTQNQENYKTPQSQDYEKYRYKHPNFKPNLQPLPKSAYQSEFFSYGNVMTFDKCKQSPNSIFPKTYGLRNSSYRDQFKQVHANKINYKQLDAYHDKFRQPDFKYFPKKRALSQTNSQRGIKKNKGNVNKYSTSLEYINKLKTQMGLNRQKRSNERLVSKMNLQKLKNTLFMTQSRKNYENPQKAIHPVGKSQIKHKNLYNLKYEFKMKVHA